MAEYFSFPEKAISLSLTANYAPSWKTWEGIRELVQNWHDGVFSSLEKLQLAGKTCTIPRFKLAFLNCKHENSLIYKAVLTAENSPIDEDKANGDNILHDGQSVLTNRTHELGQKFDDDEHCDQKTNVAIELGRIVYLPSRERLTLINYNTELMRKVLLLGFSKKASNKEVIGQFGEGLKVGALALVREGRVVSMETSRDRWKFGLSRDDTFEEDVLTVFVNDRNKENDDDDCDSSDLGQTDTRVTVYPLCREDWEVYVKRFLFLQPTLDCVKSEVGTLLIGDHYKGQLYVKGVWVSDLSKDGLASGVDLIHLKIDRDRRAVIHLSEIDHQVSSMWVHAIEQRPDLISHYYSLLEENNTSDVRHANFYLTDKSAFLVAQQFFAIHGQMTYPVLNTVSAEVLDEIKREIYQKLVLCNESLINALYKSGEVETLDTILSGASTKKAVLVPYADLSQDEINVLKHVEKLVQTCCPEFAMVSMDISESARKCILLKEFGHYEIPRSLLSATGEHYCDKNCARNGFKCLCREAFIAAKVLTLQPNYELIQAEKRSSDCDDDWIVKLLASLSIQVCQLNTPFCKDLHEKQASVQNTLDQSVLRDREIQLQREKDLLTEKLLQKDKSHAQELLKLQTEISSLEKDLVRQQVNLVNIEQEISETWKKSIQKLRLEMSELSNTITELKRDKIFYKEKLAAAIEDANNKQKAHTRQIGVLNDRSDILRKQLANKFEKLSQIVLASKEANKSVAEILKSTTKEIEEMWFQKDNCIICTLEKPNCVVIPCRHQITCFKCTSFLVTCSYCRGPIHERILTYGL